MLFRTALRQQAATPRSTLGHLQMNAQFNVLRAEHNLTVQSYNVKATQEGQETQNTFLLRVPAAKDAPAGKAPVLLQHGIFDTSACFYFQRELGDTLLGVLHKAGHDVWLGNSRGTRMTMPRTPDADYWANTTFLDMAKYDVPNNLQFIEKTRKAEGLTTGEGIHYVGHSQGTTQMFAALADSSLTDLPIASFQALAPVPKMTEKYFPTVGEVADLCLAVDFWSKILPGHQGRFLQGMSSLKDLFKPVIMQVIEKYYAMTGMQPAALVGENDAFLKLLAVVASPEFIERALRLACSTDSKQPTGTIDMVRLKENIPTLMTPGGTSVANCLAWQNTIGQEEYPFEASAIRRKYPNLPISFYVGGVDRLGDAKVCRDFFDKYIQVDQKMSSSASTSSFDLLENYSHLEFTWGKNAQKDVYQNILQRLR